MFCVGSLSTFDFEKLVPNRKWDQLSRHLAIIWIYPHTGCQSPPGFWNISSKKSQPKPLFVTVTGWGLQIASAILPPNTCRSVEKKGSKTKMGIFPSRRGQTFHWTIKSRWFFQSFCFLLRPLGKWSNLVSIFSHPGHLFQAVFLPSSWTGIGLNPRWVSLKKNRGDGGGFFYFKEIWGWYQKTDSECFIQMFCSLFLVFY